MWNFSNTTFFKKTDRYRTYQLSNNVVQGKLRAIALSCKNMFFLLRIVMVLDYFSGGF